jgi:hypothetical protein
MAHVNIWEEAEAKFWPYQLFKYYFWCFIIFYGSVQGSNTSELRTGPSGPVRPGPVQGSGNFMNRTCGPVQGSADLQKNRTKPDRGNTTCRSSTTSILLTFIVAKPILQGMFDKTKALEMGLYSTNLQ